MTHEDKLVERIATTGHCIDCGVAGRCLQGGGYCPLEPDQLEKARAQIILIQKDMLQKMMEFQPAMKLAPPYNFKEAVRTFASEIGIEIE